MFRLNFMSDYTFGYLLLSLHLALFLKLKALFWIHHRKKSNEPISNVHVLSEYNEGTFSDLNGFFQLNLKEGKHQITFQHIAYKTSTKNIEIKANQL